MALKLLFLVVSYIFRTTKSLGAYRSEQNAENMQIPHKRAGAEKKKIMKFQINYIPEMSTDSLNNSLINLCGGRRFEIEMQSEIFFFFFL